MSSEEDTSSELTTDAIPHAARETVPGTEEDPPSFHPSLYQNPSLSIEEVHSPAIIEPNPLDTNQNRQSKLKSTKNCVKPKSPLQMNRLPVAGMNTVVVNNSTGVHVGNVQHFQLNHSLSPAFHVRGYTSQISQSGRKKSLPKGEPHAERKKSLPKEESRSGRKTSLVKEEYKALRDSTDVVTQDEIDSIKIHIGVGWKDLGRRLDYSDGQLDQFYLDFEKLNMKEVIYQMLLDWKRTKSREATVGELAIALYKAGQFDALTVLHDIKTSVKEYVSD
uniref:Death domain-containing protein n=2 Tax=Timema TaxID=61471 RepID=A0A7R9FLI7_9NEOP|nr:unnamed protein product [Timema bartmani]CAD7454704.1 unnamed protein product [Timema tahoe]